jgi:hypothetical protein
MEFYKIAEYYTDLFSVCSNITTKVSTIAIFKSLVKQNNDSNKIYSYVMIFYCTKLNLSKCKGLQVVFMNFKC